VGRATQRYATTAVTSYLFREIAVQQGLPMQDFVVRNDMGCGSTIGPIMASGMPGCRIPCSLYTAAAGGAPRSGSTRLGVWAHAPPALYCPSRWRELGVAPRGGVGEANTLFR